MIVQMPECISSRGNLLPRRMLSLAIFLIPIPILLLRRHNLKFLTLLSIRVSLLSLRSLLLLLVMAKMNWCGDRSIDRILGRASLAAAFTLSIVQFHYVHTSVHLVCIDHLQ